MPPPRRPKFDDRLRPVWRATVADHVIGLAWSGESLAAAAVSGPVTVFDAAGRVAHALAGHGFGTTAVQWQPGGTLLATAGQDGRVKLWAGGTEVASLDGGAQWVERLAWHPDGTRLATTAGKKVRLWSAAGELLREYAGHAATVHDLAWQPGTGHLAAAAYGGVSLYDGVQPGAVRTFAWKGSPLVLAWSPDGKMLAHGNQDATVHFWFAAAGTPLHMTGFPAKVRELSWDATGRHLATGGGAAVCVWDCAGKGPEGRTPLMLLEDDAEAPVTAVQWQRRGPLLASAYANGDLHLWQPAAKSPLAGRDKVGPDKAVSLAWSPDDRRVAVGTATGEVAVYRVT